MSSNYSKEAIEFTDELISRHRKPNLLLKSVYVHALITLKFLMEASEGGYDYDAKFEIPLYEECEKRLIEKLEKHK